MPTPQGIRTVTLHGRYVEPDLLGTPLTGSVTFTPNVPMVVFPIEDTLMTGTETATINGMGEFTIDLPCTDTPGQNPEGWAYTVTEKLIGIPQRTYQILLPYTVQVVELADIIPTVVAPQYLPVPGPPGVAGAPGVVQSVNGISLANIVLAPADVKSMPNAVLPVDTYLTGASTSSPRFFGHRGGGMVRPEHTMNAYRATAAQGFPLEVSVNVDASGQLWCIHDTTMDRTTNRLGNVNTYMTEEVSQQVLASAKSMLGPGWVDQPLVPLRQVLDEFLGKTVMFLEAKGNDAVTPLENLLDTYYPHAPRSVIWKAHIGTTTLPWAKGAGRGYRTWVYLDPTTLDPALDAKDSQVDYWGVPTAMTDTRIQQVVARGKPVFSWPVYRRSEVTRLTGLGVVGIMASDPKYVSTALPQRTASRWDLGVKESGGTPVLDYSSTYALQFAPTPDVGWVNINSLGNQSYGLGTYCPVQAGAGGYRVAFDMKYKVLPADLTLHGGIYFGKATDDIYHFSTANPSGGYHVVMRANGQMQLFRHTPGVTSGTQIGTTIVTTAPTADATMSFQVDVTATTVELRRTDGAGWTTGAIADTTYRGLYLGLSNGSITDVTTRPYWRNLVITQL